MDSDMDSTQPFVNASRDELSDEEYRMTLTTNIVLSTILATSCVLGIIGNSLVLFIFTLSKKLQTVTNIFIVSLSITDLLGCSMLPIQMIAFLNFRDGWPLADWVCEMCGAICLIAFKASVAHLALISINRYVVVTKFRSQYLRIYSVRNVVLMVLFAWLFPILLIMLPPAAGLGELGYNEKNQVCVFDGTPFQIRIIYMFEEILFGISFIVILGCYVLIYIYVNKQHRNLLILYSEREYRPGVRDNQQDPEPSTGSTGLDHDSVTSTQSHNQAVYTIDTPKVKRKTQDRTKSSREMRRMLSRREIDITKNLFIVVCSFFFFVLPYILCILTSRCYTQYFKYTASFLVVNSCTNPFIYCLKHPSFREVASCLIRGNISQIPHPSNWLKKYLNRQCHRNGES
ncbi:G-protein coupled receptor moody-like [Diadema antillarum]